MLGRAQGGDKDPQIRQTPRVVVHRRRVSDLWSADRRSADLRSDLSRSAAVLFFIVVCSSCGAPSNGSLRAEDGAPAPSSSVWVTPTGRRYHRQDCRSLGSQGKELTLEGAVDRGLEPCKVCLPPEPEGLEPYRLDGDGIVSSAQADRSRMHSARIVRVLDGDTVHLTLGAPRPALLREEETVRLLGIDAPELAATHPSEDNYGIESAAYLRRLIEGREVLLAFDRDLRDRYGRLLAYLYTQDEACLNLHLVEKGFATAYLSFPFIFSEEFLAADVRARAAGRGKRAVGP